jgi:hypothetical protein
MSERCIMVGRIDGRRVPVPVVSTTRLWLCGAAVTVASLLAVPALQAQERESRDSTSYVGIPNIGFALGGGGAAATSPAPAWWGGCASCGGAAVPGVELVPSPAALAAGVGAPLELPRTVTGATDHANRDAGDEAGAAPRRRVSGTAVAGTAAFAAVGAVGFVALNRASKRDEVSTMPLVDELGRETPASVIWSDGRFAGGDPRFTMAGSGMEVASQSTQVPEPGSWALLGASLALLLATATRRRVS